MVAHCVAAPRLDCVADTDCNLDIDASLVVTVCAYTLFVYT
jgi:hypothetical protein